MSSNEHLPPLDTKQLLFSDEATRQVREISDGATTYRAHVLLIGIRSGSLVWIQDILRSSSLSRYGSAREDVTGPELDSKGRVRGYAAALERYTPYRHLGWLWFSRSDELLTAPTGRLQNALSQDAHWQVESSTHQIWPLVVLTARKRRKAVQLKAFEVRGVQAVEVPVQLPFLP